MSSVSKPYADCQVGEHFFYGSYPQGKNGEVAPIEWRVLARESDRLLVIAEYGLDAKAYNEKWVDTNWSQCTLRSWLNGEFMEKAFSAEERENLLEVTLRNPKNPPDYCNTPGGPDTRDKVFLLSMNEAKRYFGSNDELCCKATAYAVEQGAFVLTEDNAKNIFHHVAYVGDFLWWLRSPGFDVRYAAIVGFGGSIEDAHDVANANGVVRPAVYLGF